MEHICICCEGLGHHDNGDICNDCDGKGITGVCNCHAFCSCECVCGAWDDISCHCHDY